MKARVVEELSSASGCGPSVLAKVNKNGKVRKTKNVTSGPCKVAEERSAEACTSSRMEEKDVNLEEEMRSYLDKLQELVPSMPNNKTLSKLQVITSAIFYIRDLRETLGLPPCTAYDLSDDDEILDEPEMEDDEFDLPLKINSSLISTTITPTVPENCMSSSAEKSPVTTFPSPPVSPVSHSPSILCSTHTHPASDCERSTKRQPLCVITSPNNTASSGLHGHRLSQKS